MLGYSHYCIMTKLYTYKWLRCFCVYAVGALRHVRINWMNIEAAVLSSYGAAEDDLAMRTQQGHDAGAARWGKHKHMWRLCHQLRPQNTSLAHFMLKEKGLLVLDINSN